MGLYHHAGPSTPFAFVHISAFKYIHFIFKTHKTEEQNDTISAEKCHPPSSPLQHNSTFLHKGRMKWENIPRYTTYSLVLPLNEIAYSSL